MNLFPTEISAPSISTAENVLDNSLKSQFINGMQVTRPRYSRQLKKFDVQWNAMPAAEFIILKNFYQACYGGTLPFYWIDNLDGQIPVRFNSDLNYNLVAGNAQSGIYNVKFALQTV